MSNVQVYAGDIGEVIVNLLDHGELLITLEKPAESFETDQRVMISKSPQRLAVRVGKEHLPDNGVAILLDSLLKCVEGKA